MISYRTILPSDNKILYDIIVSVMKEFKTDLKGTIVEDPTVHTMYENFQKEKSLYYIAEENGEMLGGAGIAQLDGTNENICELQRMFLLPEARGKGIGSKLMEMCMDAAKNFGYEKIYLETLDNMSEARKLYLKSGFEFISSPLGNTGHCGCNTWMVLEL
ncbi:MAG: GNAT family N-acetyltransferase [Ignavibacteria bacterium]|nr:GNAT family N-acetyltransferase [Ignavibacteria bacterium]